VYFNRDFFRRGGLCDCFPVPTGAADKHGGYDCDSRQHDT
jgi:hypothetical protein